ncbi:TIGR04282 family arsenosugar biosynthesis glycosyltransferase [Massilia sp. H6]|uniref:TIGR04282 family arsenosugar biosynthesis glycosyltransferase n=1 Tax=Massilia sp. H6 TaxID=2970464 RepID=UPI00216744CB|nr:TIGR04282 family arsenosugar biosynthesis glycosyltransferase [Massilia sp. H6]UVW30045.1 TIGR04282 family arsenosugar biosynthesis glycosyltransferase [Massilia sp. H6]
MTSDCLLIIFAKAPVAGYAKTRLAARLGPDGAARLAARMLEHTLEAARAAALGPIELCCAPDTGHPQFALAHQRHAVHLSDQGEGDLGQRMARASARGLERHRSVILIGTDAPGLDAGVLRQAGASLRTHDVVAAPASDGGYVLIGLSVPAPGLFADVAWSTDAVMAQTRARADTLGLRLLELATLHDVDEPADLVHLPSGWLP